MLNKAYFVDNQTLHRQSIRNCNRLAALAGKKQHLFNIFQVFLYFLVFTLNFGGMRGEMDVALEKQYKHICTATASRGRVQPIHEFNHLKKINDKILFAELIRTSFNK